ncbi:MAG: hypothetical protein JWO41_68 [Candidatus Saccharibacteria bacterium]|nr:hypothetical protein [Candidatus Saccharibacteria bacterium]
MIKKTTKAIFADGDYAGEYDWEGGIPLTQGETISVTTASGTQINYVMVDKTTALSDSGDAQLVHIEYHFKVA